MDKKYRFKQQIIEVQTMGLKVYCETEAGQYREKAEKIDKLAYADYMSWAESGEKWGYTMLGSGSDLGVTYVAMLPKRYDSQSIVNFCAGLAASTIAAVNDGKISVPMIGRLAGVIFTRLDVEEVEENNEEAEK